MSEQSITAYPISDDAKIIMNMLQRVLDTVIAIYDTHGVPLPARQYWTVGSAPEDCAQVTVSLIQTYLGPPGDQASAPQRCTGPRTAVINVAVSRDFPIGENGKAIRPERIMDASAWGAIDSMVLLDSLSAFDRWDDGGPGLGVVATVQTNDPQGGIQTTNMNLSMGVG